MFDPGLLPQRFVKKIDSTHVPAAPFRPVTGTCWIWTAAHSRNGYPQIRVGGAADGSAKYAHRVIYELLIGPIPDGHDLDHLCRQTLCVNPGHLEPVTHGENVRRGGNAAKTHCPAGHPFNDENTYHPPSHPTHRLCRSCVKAHGARYYAAERAEREARRRRA